MCLVLCLIGSSLYLFSFSFTVSVRHRVWAELDRLYTVIRYLQRKALLDGTTYSVTFDGKLGSYRADTIWHLDKSVRIGIPPGILGPPSKPKEQISHGCSWPKNTLEIYPMGSLSAGAVYLSDIKGRYIVALTVDASEITGIRRYYYDKTWHPIEPY